MKAIRNILAIVILTCGQVVLGQSTETRNLGSFDEVRVSQAISVILKSGTKESVMVDARGIDLEDVITEVSGSRLKIYLDHGRYRNVDVTVEVTYVKLSGISASSASDVIGKNVIKGDRMEISVSSAADVEVELDMKEVSVSASSSGDVEIIGKTDDLSIDVSSAGGVDAYDLEAKNVRVRGSSAGSAKVYATEEIDARASSGASIRYRGNPGRSQTDSSSGGSVRKSN